MDDTISRQAAIDAIRAVIGDNRSISVCDAIKQLPPIQPEIIHCGDGCKFWNRHAGEQAGTCDILRQCTSDSFYCGNAKRREVTT